ncbi:ImmA/IrrE family metallo-endopeptidase [Burkholderia arboris]|uniref:ImmA/IrrE family metallo-endopeptidase n=1 Tax=Burkholderia arboris TaxID=488730 RepID=UPI001CF1FC5A|nr:ImmA/IrrE family metallo-endopeptidase [Burkholderia arboris]MCA8037136.1 ImmA/IrrE family metallo-endopeptidase [Burkholderia arboris]
MVEAAAVPLLRTVDSLRGFLIEHHRYDLTTSAPPIDVDKIAELLGIRVVETSTFHSDSALTDKTVGMIALEHDSSATVWINPAQNSYPPRRRFTLAHEIGHFCMHRRNGNVHFVDNSRTMSRSQSYWDRNESEANTFAADLLMPEGMIFDIGRKTIVAYKARHDAEMMPMETFTAQMASIFSVSNQAMAYRLRDLKIGPKK